MPSSARSRSEKNIAVLNSRVAGQLDTSLSTDVFLRLLKVYCTERAVSGRLYAIKDSQEGRILAEEE